MRPHVVRWLKSLPYRPSFFVEPFTGNGALALAVAETKLVDRVVAVERNYEMATVWKVILSDAWMELQEKVAGFKATRNSVRRELTGRSRGKLAVAFRCLLKDRLDPGGLLGADRLLRLVKIGRRLKRWRSKGLAAAIGRIHELKDRIQFVQGDGLAAIEKFMFRRRTTLFVDPPFVPPDAPSPPQRPAVIDYERLGKLIQSVWADSLLTCPGGFDPRLFAETHGCHLRDVWVSLGRRRRKKEIFLSRNSDEKFFYQRGAVAEKEEEALQPDVSQTSSN